MKGGKKVMASQSTRPTGVSIIAILTWIGAAITILFGIIGMFLGPALSAMVGMAGVPGAAGGFSVMGIIMGIIQIIIGLAIGYVGLGLWRGLNWARVVTLILSIVGAVMSLPALLILVGIIPLAINAVIIWYLGFNEEAKRYFGATGFF